MFWLDFFEIEVAVENELEAVAEGKEIIIYSMRLYPVRKAIKISAIEHEM